MPNTYSSVAAPFSQETLQSFYKTKPSADGAGASNSLMAYMTGQAGQIGGGTQQIAGTLGPEQSAQATAAMQMYEDALATQQALRERYEEAMSIYGEGVEKYRTGLAETGELATQMYQGGLQSAADVIARAEQHYEDVVGRGEKAVTGLKETTAKGRERVTDYSKQAQEELAEQYEAKREQLKFDMEKTTTDWTELVKGVAAEGLEAGEDAYKRIEEWVNIAKSEYKNMTAKTIETQYDATNAYIDDQIQDAQTRASIQGDPSADAEVTRLRYQKQKMMSVAVGQAEIAHNNAMLSVNQSVLPIIGQLASVGMQYQAALGGATINGATAIMTQYGGNLGRLAEQGLTMSGAITNASFNQLGRIEELGITAEATLREREDMYASFAGQTAVDAVKTAANLVRDWGAWHLSTRLTIDQLEFRGYQDHATFYRDLPVVASAPLGLLMAMLADLSEEATEEAGQGPSISMGPQGYAASPGSYGMAV